MAFPNMTRYCGGYGLEVVGMRPEGRGSVNWRERVRSIVRACVGEGIVSVVLDLQKKKRLLEGVCGWTVMRGNELDCFNTEGGWSACCLDV